VDDLGASIADEWAASKLAHQYAYALDHCDTLLLRTLFTPDASWEFVGVPQVKRIDDIVQIPERLKRSFTRTHHAIQTQHIDLKGGEGWGVTYCMAYHVFRQDFVDASRDPISIAHNYLIRYEDRYRKTGASWQFSARKLNVVLRRVDHVLERDVLEPAFEAGKPDPSAQV
jgi:hypothetical protein